MQTHLDSTCVVLSSYENSSDFCGHSIDMLLYKVLNCMALSSSHEHMAPPGPPLPPSLPSPYTSFSDCPINYSTEDKSIGGILGHIALRTSRSRNFLDSILWMKPLGTSIDCVILFLRDYFILAHYGFWDNSTLVMLYLW